MSQAVIFDLDGVLIDSFEAHWRSWADLAARTGVDFSRGHFAETFGRTSRDIIRRFWGAEVDEVRIRELDRWKETRFREIVAADCRVMDGAAELLLALRRAGVPLALGTSAPPENAELALGFLARLVPRPFEAVVTGADVERGKPDPQVFLLAAGRLGVAPRRCAVIEDAPAGIEAARAAGMAAVGLASTGRRREDLEAAGPRLVVASLRELTVPLLQALP